MRINCKFCVNADNFFIPEGTIEITLHRIMLKYGNRVVPE
jgi:hypothetical protein